MKAKYKEFK